MWCVMEASNDGTVLNATTKFFIKYYMYYDIFFSEFLTIFMIYSTQKSVNTRKNKIRQYKRSLFRSWRWLVLRTPKPQI